MDLLTQYLTDDSWNDILYNEIQKEYFKELEDFLEEELNNKTVYPTHKLMFNAFNLTPFNQVKVVIIGQDPYHGKNQANGLCFSVNDGIKIPPSLNNIFKEIKNDLGKVYQNGNLEHWAKQGVLLLNTILTVEQSKPGSHKKKGWEIFTDYCIKELSAKKNGLIFILWGNYAKKKKEIIDTKKHFILEAAHPSPFSAHNGFFGCKHFSKTNAFLKQQNSTIISW